jgi:Phage integrase family
MPLFRKDLAAAGIPYIDAQDRQADFHALRHTFATNLNRAGVTPRAAMELMRHSDMRLTAKTYTDVQALPLMPEVLKLPFITPSPGASLNSEKGSPKKANGVQGLNKIWAPRKQLMAVQIGPN